jgi:hypothetical protein
MPNHRITRFSVKGFGELYSIAAPFFVFGVFLLLKHIRERKYQVLLLWLLLYPVGSVVAGADGGGPFATRSIIGVVVFQIVTALGISALMYHFKNILPRIFILLLIVSVFCTMVSYYMLTYFFVYPTYSSGYWGFQYGTRQIVQYFVEHQLQYDEEILYPVFNEPEIFFAFYAPSKCQKCMTGKPSALHNPYRKRLYALPAGYFLVYPNSKFKKLKQIRSPYSSEEDAFFIGELGSL